MPDVVATADEPAQSPSGQYLLVVVSGYDGFVRFQSFQVLGTDGEMLYMAPERFAMRHTTYFLWDQDDRVWVYSGDLGTFFWELNVDSREWEQHAWVDSQVSVPDFLKEMMPERYKK